MKYDLSYLQQSKQKKNIVRNNTYKVTYQKQRKISKWNSNYRAATNIYKLDWSNGKY